jgi:hypothetical protein
MMIIDIEHVFGRPNAALKIEIKPTMKRPSCKNEHIEVTDAMVKYALETALAQITCKER